MSTQGSRDKAAELLDEDGYEPTLWAIAEALDEARAQAFTEAANRLTITEPQAALNWMADQARIARGEEPYRAWT